jgi:hypothetical protein
VFSETQFPAYPVLVKVHSAESTRLGRVHRIKGGRSNLAVLVVAVVDGERYLVSMLGEDTNWVRNVRAGGEVVLCHGRREEVRLEEVAPDRRAPVLKACLKRAPNARAHVPIDEDAPLAEFERVASRFPVFRVAPRY